MSCLSNVDGQKFRVPMCSLRISMSPEELSNDGEVYQRVLSRNMVEIAEVAIPRTFNIVFYHPESCKRCRGVLQWKVCEGIRQW
jgi:hypothetical protein